MIEVSPVKQTKTIAEAVSRASKPGLSYKQAECRKDQCSILCRRYEQREPLHVWYSEAGGGAVRSSALPGSAVQCRAHYDVAQYVGLACGRARRQGVGQKGAQPVVLADWGGGNLRDQYD